MGEPRSRRRRRSPQVAEREILDAARDFLRLKPFRELTVDEVMKQTELSRPSFYVYFKDRHQLILRLVADTQSELHVLADAWFKDDGDEPAQQVRRSIEGIVALWFTHGPTLAALAQAAADDPTVDLAYRTLIAHFVDAAAARIEQQISDGVVGPLDAHETAQALTLMTEAYLRSKLGVTSEGVDQAPIIDALQLIWVRTLYVSQAPVP